MGEAPLTFVRTGRGRLLHDLRRHGHDSWCLRRLGVCASTETELSQWLVQHPRCGLHSRAVLADHQIRAHGQYGRRWMASRGGVWLSAALPWPQQQCSTGLFGLTVALALAEQVESTGLQVSIKWPNDLLIDSRKLAGVLPTLVFRGSRVRLARIGVGLNVSNPVPPGAVSLRERLSSGRCRLRVWQGAVLRALDRARELALDPCMVVRGAEQRLWAESVADPGTGEAWQVRGIGMDGRLLLEQGTRRTSWTRWTDSPDQDL
ncbi:Bifunctional ligase/repressor BirA [Synechococcus sp. MIT S9509]|uniref:biotin--[acetyl-CoA-carboxylase] ligase n=1 Tax=Synechococcus sp. MIT S9509 TaxID=1801630 RepID=UPI0007BBCB63|nr:biotin--[acetyl-CoA-carboxylase] ligase [Synechococcus sp. MIT S9509]KZR93073.1 Bifunctional ligase/repressor BirA [Synechococcus sp. MIT S9509]